ncbi:MAG: hypothetical protein ILP07_10785 [Treponema sp.]|nr:hypothetical protein [Treponema sp.]
MKKSMALFSINISIIICAALFSNTKGLMTGMEYVKDFPSSMADNGIEIEFSRILFLIPLIASVINYKKYSLWKFIIFNLVSVFQLFLLIGPLLDGCSYLRTIVYGKNIALLLYFVSYFAFVELSNYLFIAAKRKRT